MTAGCGCSSNGETLIFTCAGAAHSGQVANRAGIGLMQQVTGNLFCVAAVGAAIPDKMARARKAGKRVVIDGSLANNGMVGFSSIIDAAAAEAIRAFVTGQANDELAAAGASPAALH